MKYLFYIIALTAIFFPAHAHAQVTLSFQGPARIPPGQVSVISVVAKLGEAINAVSGTITYDPARVQISELQDGDSPVQLWLTRPQVRTPGEVAFEGVVPGGIGPGLTDTIVLFKMLVIPTGGTVRFDIKDPVIYLNQPDPHLAVVSVQKGEFIVDAHATVVPLPPSDTVGLETDIRIARIPDTGDNAQMLLFSVHLGGVSIPELSVRERFLGIPGAWHTVISPYRLSDQSGLSIIEARVPGSDTDIFLKIPVKLYALWILIVLGIGGVMFKYLHT